MLIWYFISSFHLQNMISIFNHWDAAHYSIISSGNGYLKSAGSEVNAEYAFFPLWPLFVRIVSQVLGYSGEATYALVGSGLSCFIFILFLRLVYKSNFQINEMRPKSWMGWFLLLFSPASYIFHTNHTESLFLLLSWCSFSYALKGGVTKSSILAGLCALTKNQGIIVAILIGIILFFTKEGKQRDKIKYFLLSGMISGSIFSLWLIFQYIQTGNPIAFLYAQKYWNHAKGFSDYIWTFFYNFRYVIQLDHGTRSFRAILFYIGIGVSIYCFFFKKYNIKINGKYFFSSKIFGFYILICSALLPAQGNLENTFRYHLILFPLWFILGDLIYNWKQCIKSKVLSRFFEIFIVTGIFILNLYVVYLYGMTRWAY